MRKSVAVLAVVLLGLTGCQKLNFSKTYEVPMRDFQPVDFSAPAYAQNVRATIEPESTSVSAYLVKTENVPKLELLLDGNKTPPAEMILAGKTYQPKDSRQDIVLEATVPAKTPYTLLIHGGNKRTNVKVRVVGR